MYKEQKRLSYFDALRGFSMIFVVFWHVMLFSLNIGTEQSVVNQIAVTFRMPLFFFVSGFFAYRASTKLTASLVGNILKRKIQAQVICTIVFFSIYQLCQGQSIFAWVHDGFKGFWFTIALFQMFIVFLMLSFISRLFKKEYILGFGLLFCSLIWILPELGLSWLKYFRDSELGTVLCQKNVYYHFQFFALGIFFRKYWTHFTRILAMDWLRTGTIIIFVISIIFLYTKKTPPSPIFHKTIGILVRYAGLMVVVSFFFYKKEFFNENNMTSRLLKYIGQRTLDIYMLHYFLLPDLEFLKPYLITGNTVVVQTFFGIAISMAIISLCLLISNVLRSSNFLASWLFGVKPPSKTPIENI
ncbi:acyltransferase family protein [Akkermansia muciniphila]|uniref:acyltransferase family protein n=1 Tax=Akkermansia muciniphila TaxID=239935 RepID=UPI000FE17A3F|nr:acyltransferase [Akkermansia muciniphila]QAA37512.1 hypothetical protein C1I88_11795 [Akkermansia muciniphila]